MKKHLKNEKAITLIALVITIVILIILAGVLVSITLGNNGLFNKAKTASEMYANAQDYENIEIAKTANEIDTWTRTGNNSNYEETILYQGTATSGTITFSNNHTINDFDEIIFVSGLSGYMGMTEHSLKTWTWKLIIDNTTGGEYETGIYDNTSNNESINIGYLTDHSFEVRPFGGKILYAVIGINY